MICSRRAGASQERPSGTTATRRAWIASSGSCRLVCANDLLAPHRTCVGCAVGETARCAAGVRTNALHNAGFVMMLMDIAIRFSKNGKMKITDADGNEQVRPILPNHCIRAHSHCVVEQTNRCWCALFVGDIGPMWCFACTQKSACKGAQGKCCPSPVFEYIRNRQKKKRIVWCRISATSSCPLSPTRPGW